MQPTPFSIASVLPRRPWLAYHHAATRCRTGVSAGPYLRREVGIGRRISVHRVEKKEISSGPVSGYGGKQRFMKGEGQGSEEFASRRVAQPRAASAAPAPAAAAAAAPSGLRPDDAGKAERAKFFQDPQISTKRKTAFFAISVVAFGLGVWMSMRLVKEERKEEIDMFRKSGAGAGAGAVKSANNDATLPITSSSSSSLSTMSSPAEAATVYHRPEIALSFDSEVGYSESLFGITGLRRKLVEQAHGRVLEVGAGTGRNTEYYRLDRCDSVTLLDQSGPMLDVARRKWAEWKEKRLKELVGEGDELTDERKRGKRLMVEVEAAKVRFMEKDILSDAGGLAVTATAGDGTKKEQHGRTGEVGSVAGTGSGAFDTVVQTMSLCSTASPVSLLARSATLTAPGSGRILLLEHGRSHYGWLNRWLDRSAAAHAEKFGCWWNRDIGEVVRQSGLEVVEMKRYHLGTTWWVVLRRPSDWSVLGVEELCEKRDG